MIQINGETREGLDGATVEEMVEKEGFSRSRIAVEVNGRIVSKPTYPDVILHDGDIVEVVSFVGGG